MTSLRRQLLAWTVTVAFVAFGVWLWVRLPVNQPREISGEVTCTSGAPVSGVYVGDDYGGGDFATWDPVPGRASSATFSFRVRSRSYVVKVGCGRKAASGQWLTEIPSGPLDSSPVTLTCADDARDQRARRCVPRPHSIAYRRSALLHDPGQEPGPVTPVRIRPGHI